MRSGLALLAALATLSGAQAADSGGVARPPDDVALRRAEQESPRKLVPFDPAHFDKYVGYYELAPNLIFQVTRKGDKFYDQLTRQQPVELFPESETKFFETVVAAQLSFVSDGGGQVTGLVLHQNGQEQPAPRISEDSAKALEADLATRIRNNTPSPGTEASIRKWLLALIAGQPNYEDMTPPLAEAARVQWPQTSQIIKPLGAVKTITFLQVDPRGNDVYRVEFEHAQAEVMVAPLTADGKVAGRGWRVLPNNPPIAEPSHRRDNAPSPGTEAYLRQYLVSASKGQPDYSGMDPALAAGARAQWPTRGPVILARGPLKSLTFLRVSPEGYDVYDAVYEHAEVLWTVAPLGQDGKESYASGVPLSENRPG